MRYQISSFQLFTDMLAAIPDGDKCLEWPRTLGPAPRFNYGQLTYLGQKDKVHRLAYKTMRGPIPPGMKVCHKCDNPPCFRPDHLFLGTNSDNMKDSVAKGRYNRAFGERHGTAHLTENDIREIRKLGAEGWEQRPLAARFKTSQSNIWRILRRKNWTHL